MGTFTVACELQELTGNKPPATITGVMVDTGSEYTWLPEDLLQDAGVAVTEKDIAFVMANALVRALGDESRWVRRNALEALGTIGSRGGGVLSGLLAALRDGEYVVRRNAAIALSKVAGPAAGEAVSALSETLLRGERYVSFYAATALGRIGTGEARRALLEALPDTDTGTGFAVTAALRQTDEAQ